MKFFRSNFKFVIFANILIFFLSSIIWLISLKIPNLIRLLSSAIDTPWGVLTSIFAHWSFSHYSENIIMIIFYSILFIAIHYDSPINQKNRRSKFYFFNIFLSAILANIIYIIFKPDSFSAGASSAGFASLGMLMGFTIKNVISQKKKLISKLRNPQNRNSFVSALANLTIIGYILYIIIFLRFEFIATGPNANYFIHALSFIISVYLTIVSGFVYSSIHKLKNRRITI